MSDISDNSSALVTVVVVTFFSKNNLTPPQLMRFLRAAFRDLAMFFYLGEPVILSLSMAGVGFCIV